MPTIAEVLPILALLISAAALWRNVKGDSKSDGAQISEVLVKMELVQSDLKEIKADFKSELKSVKSDMESIKDRVTIVEQSAKSAHKRIDGLHHEHVAEE